jgi:hypothetical protein
MSNPLPLAGVSEKSSAGKRQKSEAPRPCPAKDVGHAQVGERGQGVRGFKRIALVEN